MHQSLEEALSFSVYACEQELSEIRFGRKRVENGSGFQLSREADVHPIKFVSVFIWFPLK